MDLPPGLPELLRVGMYQYECDIAIFLRGIDLLLDLPSGVTELSDEEYQYECQISISWRGIDLPLDIPPCLPELSE